MLTNKNIVLGVTGSIAIYKGIDLARKLTQAGASVDVVMTESAMKFVSPMIFRSITHRPVVTDMFALISEFSIQHVSLAKRADIMIIAPATANIIAKLACGMANDMITCVALATKAPIIISPAMESNMYQNAITQENLSKLHARGFHFIEPGTGSLASGAEGVGRLADIEDIVAAIEKILAKSGDLADIKIIVTAGGTQEPIDPVRHIGNRSSGKMGYAIAVAAHERGAQVTLIAGPTALPDPAGVSVVHIRTATELQAAINREVSKSDILIMAAAVADYRPVKNSLAKIKSGKQNLILELTTNPDIISSITGKILKIGFAAESEDLIANAQRKLEKKHLDMIVANDITSSDSGFDVDVNRVTLIEKDGKPENLPLLPKIQVANIILDRVIKLINTAKSVKRNKK